MKQYLSFLFAIFSLTTLFAQQTITGRVIDKDSEMPLLGATVLLNSDNTIGVTTNEDGYFKLAGVPLGRQSLSIQFIGYKTSTIPNILVTAGKQPFVNIRLQEDAFQINEVVVVAKKSEKDLPKNDMAIVSAKSFNLEETGRFSGGRLDVSRLVRNFAGVANTDDSRNDIVIRGNSPTGVLWRLQGSPIPNPNHFAVSGTTGGPVSALNTDLIKTSDFFTGAFPSEYGNALSGVFDVEFRTGNREKIETKAQIHATGGLEALVEGPISKAKGSTFLVAYRYSITALNIIPIGTNSIPRYQDLSFNFDFGNSKIGRFQFYGLGGVSDIAFLSDQTDKDDLFSNPNQDLSSESKIGILGLSHKLFLSEKTYLKTILSGDFSGNNVFQDNYTTPNRVKYRAIELKDQKTGFNVSSLINSKINSKMVLRYGAVYQLPNIVSKIDSRNNLAKKDFKDIDGDGIPEFVNFANFDDTLSLLQVFAQTKYRISNTFSFNLGLHSQYFNYNQSFVLEPRTGVSWDVTPTQNISLAYGLHSQRQPIPVLLLKSINPNTGMYEQTNKDLGFTKSNQYVLAYNNSFSKDWRFKVELYYQYLQNAPIEKNPSSYSVLNNGSDFRFQRKGNLENKGTGENYGLEWTVEKFFSKNYYVLFTGSLFDSTYKGSDDIKRNTAFNNKYVLNALTGYELPVAIFSKQKTSTIFVDTKVTTAGGRYYTPVDLQATIANNGNTVYQEGKAFSEQFTPYFRIDLKIGVRSNTKNKISQQWSIDFLNVTNHQNIFLKRYNEVTNEINDVYQLGRFLDILYQISF